MFSLSFILLFFPINNKLTSKFTTFLDPFSLPPSPVPSAVFIALKTLHSISLNSGTWNELLGTLILSGVSFPALILITLLDVLNFLFGNPQTYSL